MKPFLALILLALAGCSAVPMTPEQWAREQRYRREASQAGVAYKGPHEIRREAEEMRRLAETVLASKP